MKGICFIEPLFHKVEDGSKTETRRIIKNPKIQNGWIINAKTKYKSGEVVYLKEPYRDNITILKNDYSFVKKTYYKFSMNCINELKDVRYDTNAVKFWKNKLFMPESAARLFIEILDVRVERLQDISEEDCIKEGITFRRAAGINWYENGIMIKRKDAPPQSGWPTAREAYAALIDHINGKGTWDSNPLVYVYEFKKYDRTLEY